MKQNDYAQLVENRKACNACVGLTSPSQVERGCFDSDHIGPWSRWQGNLSADLMVVGQDWGDIRYFRRHEGWDEDRNPTNQTLMKLLKSIGVVIDPPGPSRTRNVVFFTNAVLCLKEGGLQGVVRWEWFKNCGPFLHRQVEIVAPKVVVAMGNHAPLASRGDGHLARAVAAWLARRLTSVTLRELSIPLGLSRPESVSHLTRRIDRQLETDWKLRNAIRAIELKLSRHTKNKV